jgi:hypothetical protein
MPKPHLLKKLKGVPIVRLIGEELLQMNKFF